MLLELRLRLQMEHGELCAALIRIDICDFSSTSKKTHSALTSYHVSLLVQHHCWIGPSHLHFHLGHSVP
jgi:hypothetical protein